MSKYQTPYQALGEEGIRKICNAFYDIMDELPEAAELRRMHADNLEPMKVKLADYLTGWMGGPPLYADKHGTVCMTTPHEHYAIGPRERDQWLLCMEKALVATEVEEEVRSMLKEPLFRVADAVRNRPESITNDDPNIIAIG
ncbi:globin [Halieaceae bacterium IMCC14734]|uniref:Globin n=1 Tax=Candidatus Litorirhabdus singularis TaxID=2518993 RepID=A0ABT3TI19_9GAMM|nr:group II truncated hemoglobin [Candidatus Litorirhabdus singularis]MCX2981855.1 globin [Candidatus Litorirhabdus singularis]